MRSVEETTGVKYIEELDRHTFLEIKGAGKQTWLEFVALKGVLEFFGQLGWSDEMIQRNIFEKYEK